MENGPSDHILTDPLFIIQSMLLKLQLAGNARMWSLLQYVTLSWVSCKGHDTRLS